MKIYFQQYYFRSKFSSSQVYQVKDSVSQISQIICPIYALQKGNALVGSGELYNLDLTHDLDIDFFKVRFQIVVYHELLVKLMQSKKK